jgi:hypothetical protein
LASRQQKRPLTQLTRSGRRSASIGRWLDLLGLRRPRKRRTGLAESGALRRVKESSEQPQAFEGCQFLQHRVYFSKLAGGSVRSDRFNRPTKQPRFLPVDFRQSRLCAQNAVTMPCAVLVIACDAYHLLSPRNANRRRSPMPLRDWTVWLASPNLEPVTGRRGQLLSSDPCYLPALP